MAKYTTSVRSICEINSGLDESKGQASVNDIIANSRDKIFDFPYPIYDEDLDEDGELIQAEIVGYELRRF